MALDALIQAKALTENGSEDALVVLVHSGTIDLSDERAASAGLAEWIDSLGDRFITIQTRPDGEEIFTGAELENMTAFNLNASSQEMLEALTVQEIRGAIQSLTAQSASLPAQTEKAERAEKTDGTADEAEEADEAIGTGMQWTFEMKADGVKRLMVLAEADEAPETLWLAGEEHPATIVKAEYTALGERLLIDCRFDEPLDAGKWTLMTTEGALGENIALVPCWSDLSAELTMAPELECGARLEGTVTLKAGEAALDVAGFLAETGMTLKLDVQGEKAEEEQSDVHYSCGLDVQADGRWMYNMTLAPGTYTMTVRLYDAQGNEWTQCAGESITVVAENVAPAVVGGLQTEYEFRYNDGEDDCEEAWSLKELFEDTIGDTLYYTVEGDLESEIFDVVRMGNTLSVSLSDKEEGECRLTLSATDKALATAQTELVIRSIDYLRLQRETTFELAVEKTDKKDHAVTVSLTPVFPEEMDAAFAQEMLKRVHPVLTVNGKALELTENEQGWACEFFTEQSAQEYVVSVTVSLDIAGYGADEGQTTENLTVVPDKERFATQNTAPYAAAEDRDYKLTVEPFLKKQDYVSGEVLDPTVWFGDEDGDALIVTAFVQNAALSLNEGQLRIDSDATSGNALEITGEVALAAIKAGAYDVVFTAMDVDGASAQVTVHVKAQSQTVRAWIIIALAAALAAVVGVLLILNYRRKPSFKTMKGAWHGQIKILKVSVFGTQREAEVDLSEYGKNAVTLFELVRQSGLVRVQGLDAALLKGVILTPDHRGVRVRSKLSTDYSLSAGDKLFGGDEEKVESGTRLMLKKSEKPLLEIRLEQTSAKG